MTEAALVAGRAELGFGTAPLGNLFSVVSEDDARHALEVAWARGVRHFDTAPFYGSGLAEERLGGLLAAVDADQVVLSTKVGRTLVEDDGEHRQREGYFGHRLSARHDFSRDAIRRGLESSLLRLGVDSVDTVYLHDPEDHLEQAREEGYAALVELRAEGVISRIGVGTNFASTAAWMVDAVELDSVMLAGRWTLLDRTAGDQLLPLCLERGVDVHAAGIFNSGILATANPSSHFDYASPPADVLARSAQLRALCDEFGVPIGAAAIQFAARHPAVTRVVVGARSAAQLETDLDWAAEPIPDALWEELDRT